MAIAMLDNEFMQYWSKLTVVEKESLLLVARNYVLSKQAENTTELRRTLILEERENCLKGKGNSYSWEEVKAMAIDKSKRHNV